MSWFSLSVQGKGVVDQYSSVTSYFTGNFISNFIYEKAIKNNPLNILVRETAINQLASVAAPQLEPVTKKISNKILKTTFNEEKVLYAFTKLKEKFYASPTAFFTNTSKFTFYLSKELAKKMANKMVGSPQGQPQGTAQSSLVMPQKLSRQEFLDAFQATIVQSLTPMCEEAVQKALVGATKATGEKVYDFTVKKTCSITVMPMVYGAAYMAFEVLGNHYQISVLNYLPKVSTILGSSILCHAAQMASVIWEGVNKPVDKVDLDKKEIKNMALKFAQEKLSQKIGENKMLSSLGMNETAEDIDQLLNLMVTEAVDFYWNDLHETKVFGLPLVS